MNFNNQQDMELLAEYLHTTSKRRILIVEDDFMQSLYIKEILLEMNDSLEIDILSDAAESMSKIIQEKNMDPYDLVICDVNLGANPSGNLVAYQCNFIYPSPKTILISSSPETVDTSRKFDRFLSKPIVPMELLRAVNELIRS